MRVSVVAFHGDFANGEMLREDMGDPDWVDWYVDHQGRGRRDLPDEEIIEELPSGPLVCVGYSDGGDTVARLSTLIPERFVAAVVYEAPVVSVPAPGGDFPVLSLWNYGSRKAQSELADEAVRKWAYGRRDFSIHFGKGRHTKWVWRNPWWLGRRLGHGWDLELNPYIHRWIREKAGLLAKNAAPISRPATTEEL